MNLTELRRLVRVAAEDADLMTGIPQPEGSMLSPGEQAALYQLVRLAAPRYVRIAELGAYLGGTTRLLGEALHRAGIRDEPRLEVYDFFEHNPSSRARLAAHPLSDDVGFFAVWEQNTRPYADLIDLRRGDLRTVSTKGRPLWMLFVDIVKHEVLVNPLMNRCLRRLAVGGLLVHQDYFHWQSPWVVYTTERIMDHLDLVGTVSNHMMILQLREPIPAELLELDYVDGLDWTDKDLLMQRAIDRFSGVRAGLLRVSRLNLMSIEGLELPEDEVAEVRTEYAAYSRVLRYLDGVVRLHAAKAPRAVW